MIEERLPRDNDDEDDEDDDDGGDDDGLTGKPGSRYPVGR